MTHARPDTTRHIGLLLEIRFAAPVRGPLSILIYERRGAVS